MHKNIWTVVGLLVGDGSVEMETQFAKSFDNVHDAIDYRTYMQKKCDMSNPEVVLRTFCTSVEFDDPA